jgi:hypothetical protein
MALGLEGMMANRPTRPIAPSNIRRGSKIKNADYYRQEALGFRK